MEIVMKLRCPYPEPRDVPWLGREGDRAVQPDEIVDIPDEYVENFLAAGWTKPDAPAAAKKAPAAATTEKES